MEITNYVLNWVIHAVNPNATVQSVERLKGSTSSTLHSITLQDDKKIEEVVLRQFDNKEWLQEEPDLALHEAGSLRLATKAGLSAPEIIAYDDTGEVCSVPLVLMSKLEGSVDLKPYNMDVWVSGLAKSLIKIHAVDASEFQWNYFSYNDASKVAIPTWSSVPGAWEKTIEIVKGPRPKVKECFIHRDYHPANVLWKNGSVSGVVDWVNACKGSPGIDIGHCRWNLAMLYDVEVADKFLAAYQEHAEKSYIYDPYWDLLSLINVLFGPPEVYPGWAAFGVTGLTDKMMKERMDRYVVSLIERYTRQ